MPCTEYEDLSIRPINTRCRAITQHRTSGANANNLIMLTNKPRWSLPVIMCLNARSLSIEKSDKLLAVVRTNDVGCVCVTETWFKPYMSTESVGLVGFCRERKDRLEK